MTDYLVRIGHFFSGEPVLKMAKETDLVYSVAVDRLIKNPDRIDALDLPKLAEAHFHVSRELGRFKSLAKIGAISIANLHKIDELESLHKKITRQKMCQEILLLEDEINTPTIKNLRPQEVKLLFANPGFDHFEAIAPYIEKLELCRDILLLEVETGGLVISPMSFIELLNNPKFDKLDAIKPYLRKLELCKEILLFSAEIGAILKYPPLVDKLFNDPDFKDVHLIEPYVQKLRLYKGIVLLEREIGATVRPKEVSEFFMQEEVFKSPAITPYIKWLKMNREVALLEKEAGVTRPDQVDPVAYLEKLRVMVEVMRLEQQGGLKHLRPEEIDTFFTDEKAYISTAVQDYVQKLKMCIEIMQLEEAAGYKGAHPPDVGKLFKDPDFYASKETKIYIVNLRNMVGGIIVDLERRAGLKEKLRPVEVVKLLKDGVVVRPEAIKLYIEHLRKSEPGKTFTEEYGEDETDDAKDIDFTTGVTLLEEPTYIQVTEEDKKILGRGSFGVAETQEGLTQTRQGFVRETYVSKSDLAPDGSRGVTGTTRSEYYKLKALWELVKKASPEDLEYIYPLVASHQEKRGAQISSKYLTKLFSEGSLKEIEKLPPGAKSQVARSLIRSLIVALKYGFVWPDIKTMNMLCTIMKDGSYRALLSDPGGLTNMKEIVDNPTQEKLDRLLFDIRVWTPTDLPYPEYLKIYEELERVNANFGITPVSETRLELEKIQKRLDQLQKFNLAAILYRMYTHEYPYDMVQCKQIPGHLSGYGEYTTTKPPDQRSDYSPIRTKFEDKLKAANCPQELAALIVGMLNPNPTQRPALIELA